MFSWILRWLFFRSLALVIGGGLYLYMAFHHTDELMFLHDFVGEKLKVVRDSLPRQSRVIFHNLGFERTLVMLAFVFAAMLVCDFLVWVVRLCARGIVHLYRR